MSRKPPGKPPSQRGNRPEPYNPNDVRFVAYHEAGHAVSAVLLGFNLKTVDIRRRRLPDGTASLGFTDTGKVSVHEVAGLEEDEVIRHLVQTMTGMISEACINPRMFEYQGHRQDMEDGRRIAAAAVCNLTTNPDGTMEISSAEQHRNRAKIKALVDSAIAKATKLIEDNRGAIESVADFLVDRESLTGDEVEAIVKARMPLQPPPTDRHPSWGQDDEAFRQHLINSGTEKIEWYYSAYVKDHGHDPLVLVLNLSSAPGYGIAVNVAGERYVAEGLAMQSEEIAPVMYYATNPIVAECIAGKADPEEFRRIASEAERMGRFLVMSISQNGATLGTFPKPSLVA